MTFPNLPAGRTAKLCGVCGIVALVDPTLLFLFGCLIVLVALFVTWRPAPKSKL